MAKEKTKQITIREYVEKANPARFRQNRKYPDKPLSQQAIKHRIKKGIQLPCLLYTSPSPRDRSVSRMPSSA